MKRLRVILLFLLLGAIVNVAVAWVIALTVTLHDLTDKSDGRFRAADEIWSLVRFEAFGSQIYMSRRNTIQTSEKELFRYKAYWKEYPIESVKPYWGSMEDISTLYQSLSVPSEHRLIREVRDFEARGWPMLSLWCMRTHSVVTEWGLFKDFEPRGFIATPILPIKHWGPRVLPLNPIWIGFIVNMLFYALFMWLLFPGPFVLRRIIRHRRGLCVKCAYDLRGAEHEACPECGQECLSS